MLPVLFEVLFALLPVAGVGYVAGALAGCWTFFGFHVRLRREDFGP